MKKFNFSYQVVALVEISLTIMSCDNNNVSKQILLEQHRADSLLQIETELRTNQNQRMTESVENTNSYLKQKAKQEKEDSIRIAKEKREHEEFVRKENEEIAAYRKKQEEQQRQREYSSKGPSWLDGTWSITTTSYNPFTGQQSVVKSAIAIDWQYQNLTCFIDNELIESGRYTVSDGAVHCGSSYWRIDELNQRLEFGNGKYYTKRY